jgi:myo-inositol 2-dehydrogenase/D-chiro-inositol 1-dehydrogenase
MRRFDSGYRAMKAVLERGTLGAPLMVHCAHRGPSAPPTFTSDMLITDSAIHELDLMRWLLGEETVAVTVLRPRSSSIQRDLVSPQVVLLETESGVLVDIEVFANAVYGYDIRCEVVGELGTVSLGDANNVVVAHAGRRSGHVPDHWIERFRAAYDVEMQAWIDGVGEGHAVGPSAWDGYAATTVAAACLESLQSGRRVAVHMRPRPDFYVTG